MSNIGSVLLRSKLVVRIFVKRFLIIVIYLSWYVYIRSLRIICLHTTVTNALQDEQHTKQIISIQSINSNLFTSISNQGN